MFTEERKRNSRKLMPWMCRKEDKTYQGIHATGNGKEEKKQEEGRVYGRQTDNQKHGWTAHVQPPDGSKSNHTVVSAAEYISWRAFGRLMQ